MSLVLGVICAIWIIGMFITWNNFLSDNKSLSLFEKIWFTPLWPCLCILYPIYWLHKNL